MNRVEQRAALAAVGISCTGLALMGSFGLCSALGLSYGPMHSLIFCLLVGLSIDDMFVLVQTWNTQPSMPGMSLVERVGSTMRSAGVAITVTSTTNILVFLIGGTTRLPSLRSYSIFTGVGILFTFLLQLSFFLAGFALDQRRIEARRDGMCCWRVHKDHIPSTTPGLLSRMFIHLSSLLRWRSAKAVVVVTSLALTALSGWGVSCINVGLDYQAFLPSDTPLYRWFEWDAELFPGEGEEGRIYMTGDLADRLPAIDNLIEEFSSTPMYIKSVGGWYPGFKQYVNEHFRPNVSIPDHPMEEQEFRGLLTQYLFSPSGSVFQPNFEFSSPLVCGGPAPHVLVSSLEYLHPKLEGGPGAGHLAAMHWVKERVKELGGEAFPMAQAYSRWELDEVVAHELLRNILLALAMVSVVTILLLADLISCVLVLTTVLLTLIDTVGLMYLWGLTINITAATNLVISVGLCVDYSAHMALTFLTKTGDGEDRMARTMIEMGPAVLNGGLSTLLAIIMLANSKSYVFISFFKVFFLVITLGLFHGLVLLPVLLSIVQPSPYRHYKMVAHQENAQPDEENKPQCEVTINQ